MKKLFVLILVVIMMLSQVNTSYAKEYYGTAYTKKDTLQADKIYKQQKKDKKRVSISSKSEKKLDRIVSAYYDKYFPLQGHELHVEYIGKKKNEIVFVSGKKFKQAIKKERQYEKKLSKMYKEVDKYTTRIVDEVYEKGYSNEKELVENIINWFINNTEIGDGSATSNRYLTYMSTKSIIGGLPYLFVKGKGGVCADYAETFYRVCKKVGIKCYIIGGDTEDGGHAWNRVVCDGMTYNIDVTWDVCYCRIYWSLKDDETLFNETHFVDCVYE